MSAILVPCPGRRCNVENHFAGDPAHLRCQAIGAKMISMGINRARNSGGLGNLAPSAARAVDYGNDPDLNSFRGVFAEPVMVDETPSSYVYDMEMESDLTDSPVVVRMIKNKEQVRAAGGTGDPTAAEVISALALDRRSLEQLHDQLDADPADTQFHRQQAIQTLGTEYGHSLDLDFANTHIDDDGDLIAGPSDAERVYDSLLSAKAQLGALVGTDNELVLEALRREEGDAFDEQGWRHDLGLQEQPTGLEALTAPASADEHWAEHDEDSASAYLAWEDKRAEAYYSSREDAIGAFSDISFGPYLIAGLDMGVQGAGGEGDLQEGYELDDVDPSSREGAEQQYQEFLDDNWVNVKDLDPVQVASNFMKTRNGDESGSWGKDAGEAGEQLTRSAKAYDPLVAVLGDNGRVYFE